jgi:ABC-type multidrug transport system ATPase subunit/ABC-type multidrug transport system permease subunit
MSDGLELEGVSRVFGRGARRIEAIDGVTLSLPLGCKVGVVGRNGAGKTTLLRLATGLLAPTSGRVRLLGRDIADDPAVVRTAAGHLGPDERSFPPRLTPLESLALYAGLRGMGRREALRRARDRAEVLGASDLLDRPYQKLSSGQRQRIALLRALLHDPQVVLLDEPTHALDAASSRIVFELARLEAERGALVIVSSHDLGGVEDWCDELVVLDRGRVVTHGERADVLPALAAPGWRARFASSDARAAALRRCPNLALSPDPCTALYEDDGRGCLPGELAELAAAPEAGLVALERRERASLEELLAEIAAGRMPELARQPATPGSGAPPPPIRHTGGVLRALLAVVRRDRTIDLSYRFKLVLQVVLLGLWAIMFWFLARLIDGDEPELRGAPLGFLLIGLAALELSQVAMTHMANALREEQLQGTLEPLLATGRSPLCIVLGSSVWRLTVMSALAAALLGFGLAASGGSWSRANVGAGALAFLLGGTAWVALGLMSAAFVHAFKRGDPIALAFNLASLVTAGAYFPRSMLPVFVQDLTAALPHTTMLAAARAALLSGAGFDDDEFRRPLLSLAAAVLVLVPLAVVVWRMAHAHARKRGSLAEA